MFGNGYGFPDYSQMSPMLGQNFMQPQQKKQQQGGMNPLMLFSPLGGLMMSHPNLGMSLMSPAFGIAHMLGAF